MFIGVIRNRKKNNIIYGKKGIKYSFLYDYIAIFSLAYIVFMQMARNIQYTMSWNPFWHKIESEIALLWIAMAFVRSILCFRENQKKSVIALMMLIGALVCKFLGFHDYVYLVAPMVAMMNVSFRKMTQARNSCWR